MNAEATFEELRPLLTRIAYRMLGAVSDAEDVVQEAWLRWQRALSEGGDGKIAAPRPYLCQAVTRLCIDRLRALSAERRRYEGPWLPEPVVAEEPDDRAVLAESLRMGFLVLLERLSPVERAVFLLREVFDHDYPEIARIVEKSEANCRQLFARARAHMSAGRPRFPVGREEEERVAGAFFAALAARDMPQLQALLGEDAIAYSDGGGKVNAARRPVHGADRVARLMIGLANKGGAGLTVRPGRANGQAGVLVYRGAQVMVVLTLEIVAGKVEAVNMILNPDKLRHLSLDT